MGASRTAGLCEPFCLKLMDTKDVLTIRRNPACCMGGIAGGGYRGGGPDGVGVRGSTSTRWGMGETRIDHWAQFFTVRDARWQAWVIVCSQWRGTGWFGTRLGIQTQRAIRATAGWMVRTQPKFLARSLKVVRSAQILSLQRRRIGLESRQGRFAGGVGRAHALTAGMDFIGYEWFKLGGE